jgi:hypothetical protein
MSERCDVESREGNNKLGSFLSMSAGRHTYFDSAPFHTVGCSTAIQKTHAGASSYARAG